MQSSQNGDNWIVCLSSERDLFGVFGRKLWVLDTAAEAADHLCSPSNGAEIVSKKCERLKGRCQ